MAAKRAISDILDALKDNPVFGVLPDERLRGLAAAAGCIMLEPGGFLFSAGDEADALYVVAAGEIEINIRAEDGRELRLATLARGAVVGEMGVLDGGPRSAEARAGSRAELWRIGRETVMTCLREAPEASLALLAEMARRLRATDILLQELAQLDVGRRLARLLAASPTAVVARSQGDIARLIGASRERVNRRLAAWREAGWVELGPYGVRILDRAALDHFGRSAPTI